ncbi:MAG: G1 family glutamic endopeptidase [Chloroflexota bacterium]
MQIFKLQTFLLIFLALTLGGCSPSQLRSLAQQGASTVLAKHPDPRSTPTAVRSASQSTLSTATPATPTVAPQPTVMPAVASSTPTASAQPASTPVASPASTVVGSAAKQAIEAVIQKANNEQEQAFASQDDAVMRDTATSGYYAQLVQTNRGLVDGGVSSIKLIKLEWGPMTLQSTTTAQATTFETWRTVFQDGTTEQDRERNVYTLVQEGGAWKIQDDAHPDSQLDQPGGNPVPGSPGQSPSPPRAVVPARPGQSHNWSGYAATGKTFTAVSGTWTVPKPTTAGNRASGATWIGIGGVRYRDLIQAGTEETVAGSGSARYDAWIELLPRSSRTVPLTVNPGDSVSVSIVDQGQDQWLVTLKNNTTGKSYQQTEQYSSSLSSAEWVEEAPSGGRRVLPLENFGTVQFSAGSAVENGKTVDIAQSGARPISMIDSEGSVIAQPSKLDAGGSGFSVSYSG